MMVRGEKNLPYNLKWDVLQPEAGRDLMLPGMFLEEGSGHSPRQAESELAKLFLCLPVS